MILLMGCFRGGFIFMLFAVYLDLKFNNSSKLRKCSELTYTHTTSYCEFNNLWIIIFSPDRENNLPRIQPPIQSFFPCRNFLWDYCTCICSVHFFFFLFLWHNGLFLGLNATFINFCLYIITGVCEKFLLLHIATCIYVCR